MFRYILVFSSALLFSFPALSSEEEPSLIDLFGEENAKEQHASLEQLKDAQPVDNSSSFGTAEEKVDDDGIFSFLNFSFFRKKEEPPVTQTQPSTELSYEEQKIALAEKGDVDAALSLGYMYLYGENGVAQNNEKAFKYYSLAAEKEDIVALNNLGSLYFSGIGTAKDIDKAASLFKRAAELGNNESAVNLAFIYLTSSNTQDANVRSSVVRLLTQAAEKGNITAQYMLGMAYYNGFGVTKNYDRAFVYLKKSASQFDEAQYQLALRYMNAEGTPRNYGNSVNNLARAAHQGHVKSMILLGDILSSGTNYPRNEGDAYVWYNIASVYDPQNASEKRDALEKKLEIQKLLEAQAKAEKFKIETSEMTKYIHSTFGYDLDRYVNVRKSSHP